MAPPSTVSSTHALEEGPRREYHLETSHALEGRSISVKSPDGRVVWSATRSLVDSDTQDGEPEVIDTVYDSLRHPRWTIHKPTRGWYLVLRSPSLPEDSFISFKAVSSTSDPSVLTFSIRSLLRFPTSASPLADATSIQISSSGTEGENPTKEAVKSHFIVKPHLPKHTHRLSSHSWSLSSFTGLFAGRGKTFSVVWNDESGSEVLRYEDSPSILSTQTKGSLFLHEKLVDILGMEPSFWVAVTCAYLAFLEDQEAYQAAQGG